MRRALVVLVALVVALIAVPLVVPVPPLKGTVPPEELADPDSRFVDVDGLTIHYKQQGDGEPAVVLLHGFASSTFSWQAVLPSLSELGTAVAFDRPAFGLTERPMKGEWEGLNPYSPEAQAGQTIGLMDRLGIGRAVLVGHSAGGAIAVLTTLRHPDRVKALVLVAPAIYGGGPPEWLRPLLRTPQMQRLGPLVTRAFGRMGGRLLKTAWYDVSKATPETLSGYEKPLRAQDWDRALWEFTTAHQPMHLDDRLAEIDVPVLVVTGEYDRIVPPEQSVRLAEALPDAELVAIPNCGHVPQEECPEAFLGAVLGFLASQAESTH